MEQYLQQQVSIFSRIEQIQNQQLKTLQSVNTGINELINVFKEEAGGGMMSSMAGTMAASKVMGGLGGGKAEPAQGGVSPNLASMLGLKNLTKLSNRLKGLSGSLRELDEAARGADGKITIAEILDRINKEADEGQGKGLKFVKTITNSIEDFAKAIQKAGTRLEKRGKRAVDAIFDIIRRFDREFREMNTARLYRGAQAIEKFRNVLIGFSFALAVSTPLLLAGLPAAIMFPIIARSIYKGFNTVSDKEKTSNATESMRNLAIGMFVLAFAVYFFGNFISIADVLFFSLSVMLIVLPLKLLNRGMQRRDGEYGVGQDFIYLALGITVLTLAVYSFSNFITFAGILKFNFFLLSIVAFNYLMSKVTRFNPGWTFVQLAAGIFALGLSIYFFDVFVGGIEGGRLLKLAVILGAIIGIGILAGNFSSLIALGALSLTIMGVAFITLGIGLMIFTAASTIFFNNPANIVRSTLILGGLVAVFSAAGGVAPLMMAGGAAFLIVGVALISLGIGLMLFSLALSLFEDNMIDQSKKIIMGLSFAFMKAGTMAALVIPGAIAMTMVGVSLIILSVGLMLLSLSLNMFSTEMIPTMKNVMNGIIDQFKTAGLYSPLIITGSIAMILAGTALITISIGLMIFQATNFTQSDSKKLKMAVGTVKETVGGVPSGGGFLSQLGGSVAAGAQAGIIIAHAGAMVIAGTALITIATGLAAFKATGFTQEDANTMKSAITKIAEVFSYPMSEEAKEKGINPAKMMAGIAALSDAGNVLSDLARGVQEFANLTFTKYEYRDGELRPVKKVQLTEDHFNRVGKGMAKIITSISGPLAEVGRLEMGMGPKTSMGQQLVGLIGGGKGGFVSKGVASLQGIGNVLTGLARGVQEFANLTFTEYEVVNAGTKDAKVVPKKKTQLTPEKMRKAQMNIITTISTVASAFAAVGRNVVEKGGILGDDKNYAKEGKKSLEGTGKILVGLAEAIPKYANMTFIQHEIKDGKVVPKKKVQLTTGKGGDIDRAKTNMIKVLTAVGEAFAEVGKAAKGESDDGMLSSLFSGDTNYIKIGMQSIKGTGKILSNLASAIASYAKLEFPVINNKGEVVEYRKIKEGQISKAGDNANRILIAFGNAFYHFGKQYKQNKENVDTGLKITKKVMDKISTVTDTIKQVTELKPTKITSSAQNLQKFLTSVLSVFNPQQDAMLQKKQEELSKFTANIKTLSDQVQTFGTVAKHFERIEKAVSNMAKSINSIEMERLKKTAEIFGGGYEVIQNMQQQSLNMYIGSDVQQGVATNTAEGGGNESILGGMFGGGNENQGGGEEEQRQIKEETRRVREQVREGSNVQSQAAMSQTTELQELKSLLQEMNDNLRDIKGNLA